MVEIKSRRMRSISWNENDKEKKKKQKTNNSKAATDISCREKKYTRTQISVTC